MNSSISETQGYEIADRLLLELGKAIIGQKDVLIKSVAAMLANGHILLEGHPGLAKTTLVKTLAEIVSCSFSRIQFTPDLMPSDITGSLVFNIKLNDFITRRGPVFANFLLADEINRAPAKVQSALLEAMQEKQVTIGDDTYPLPEPFWVLATQNPIEQEGTYRLPEAQADRFLFKLSIDYPEPTEEANIAKFVINNKSSSIKSILTLDELESLKQLISQIFIDDKIYKYACNLVFATRKSADNKFSRLLRYGASPRGTIALLVGARSIAFLNGRNYVVPEDVIYIAKDALRHRIGLTFEAYSEEQTEDKVLSEILKYVEIP